MPSNNKKSFCPLFFLLSLLSAPAPNCGGESVVRKLGGSWKKSGLAVVPCGSDIFEECFELEGSESELLRLSMLPVPERGQQQQQPCWQVRGEATMSFADGEDGNNKKAEYFDLVARCGGSSSSSSSSVSGYLVHRIGEEEAEPRKVYRISQEAGTDDRVKKIMASTLLN